MASNHQIYLKHAMAHIHFTLQHALGCKKGGLMIFCHNKIQDELLVHLAGRALTPSAICDKSLIHPCHAADKASTCPTNHTSKNPTSKDNRVDILLPWLIWAHGTDCIVDVQVTGWHKSYCHSDPAKVIAAQEKEKKRKYLEPFLEQQCHFTPFGCSMDGLLGCEAETFAKQLATKLDNK